MSDAVHDDRPSPDRAPEPLGAGPRPPAPKQVLFCTLTALEHAQIPVLIEFGEALMQALRDRSPQEVAAYAAQDGEGNALPIVKNVRQVLAAAAMGRTELVMRAMAFVCGMDPVTFGDRVRGCEVKFNVVSPVIPCPKCTGRIAQPGKCATCRGCREVPRVIAEEHRIHTQEELRALMQPGPRLVIPGGRP